MAAGVAHELNNPLSVIAGRAQLLAQAESDGRKRHVLDVIHENAREASGVVDDLMSYAQPAMPKVSATTISQIIEEAVQLAGQKTGAEHVNAQVHISSGVNDVLVDSAQVVVAVANAIANSIEPCADPRGPVKITAEPQDGGLCLPVNDFGCGMDEATVRKSAGPFFSAKTAGRKRGMGLACAGRLIRLNRGTLKIESRPEHGTTVTITLPCEQARISAWSSKSASIHEKYVVCTTISGQIFFVYWLGRVEVGVDCLQGGVAAQKAKTLSNRRWGRAGFCAPLPVCRLRRSAEIKRERDEGGSYLSI